MYDQPQYTVQVVDPESPVYLPVKFFSSVPEAHAYAARLARGARFLIVEVPCS